MADAEFNIESLAEYLHLDRSAIQKLVDRGDIPGRKVAGAWRFAPAEIHHWLERRIGVASDSELQLVEGALERAERRADPELVSIAELLPRAAIAAPLSAKTRQSVIDSMVQLAAASDWLWDPPKLAAAIREREEMSPTALENGVALLHPRRPMPNILGQGFLALGRTERGIPFGGARGTLTDVFFLICSIEDRMHLRVLARLSRILSQVGFLDELRAATDAQEVHDLVRRVEESLAGS